MSSIRNKRREWLLSVQYFEASGIWLVKFYIEGVGSFYTTADTKWKGLRGMMKYRREKKLEQVICLLKS